MSAPKSKPKGSTSAAKKPVAKRTNGTVRAVNRTVTTSKVVTTVQEIINGRDWEEEEEEEDTEEISTPEYLSAKQSARSRGKLPAVVKDVEKEESEAHKKMMDLRKRLAEKAGVEPDDLMDVVLIDYLAEALPSDRQTFISVVESFLFTVDGSEEDAQAIWAKYGSQFLHICTSQNMRTRPVSSRSNSSTVTKTIDHSKYEFQAGTTASTTASSGKGRGQPRSHTINGSGSSAGGIKPMPMFKFKRPG